MKNDSTKQKSYGSTGWLNVADIGCSSNFGACTFNANTMFFFPGGSTYVSYDLDTRNVITYSGFPEHKYAGSTVNDYQKGILYYVGGFNRDDRPSNTIHSFDINTKTWSKLNNLDRKNTYSSAFLWENCIYIVGGEIYGIQSDKVWKYDLGITNNNNFIQTKLTLPYGISKMCGEIRDDKIYLFCGETLTGLNNKLIVLDLKNEQTTDYDLNIELSRYGSYSCSDGNNIFICGGLKLSPYNYEYTHDVFSFDIEKFNDDVNAGNTVILKHFYSMPEGSYGGTAICIADNMYINMGYTWPGPSSNNNLIKINIKNTLESLQLYISPYVSGDFYYNDNYNILKTIIGLSYQYYYDHRSCADPD